MLARRPKAARIEILSKRRSDRRHPSRTSAVGVISGSAKMSKTAPAKGTASGNEYSCAIERNQNGKYDVRIRAVFGHDGWTLSVYFLASSFNAAMKKLEESLQILQKNEEQLRFWGLERTDDPNMAGDLLEKFGLWLDRRKDFPRKAAEFGVTRERPVPASMLAPVRRVLADSVSQQMRHALAGN